MSLGSPRFGASVTCHWSMVVDGKLLNVEDWVSLKGQAEGAQECVWWLSAQLPIATSSSQEPVIIRYPRCQDEIGLIR